MAKASSCPTFRTITQMKKSKHEYETVADVLWRTWDVFWRRTSIAGLANAGGASESKARRLVWILIFAVAAGGTIWTLEYLFDDLMTYPLSTSVQYNFNEQVFDFIFSPSPHPDPNFDHFLRVFFSRQILFPAITVCNQNRVDCTVLNNTIGDCNRTIAGDDTDCPFKADNTILSTLENMNKAYCQKQKPPEGGKGKDKGSGGNEQDPRPPSADFLAESKFLNSYMALNESIRKVIGHSFENFVKDCTFAGISCYNSSK